MQRVPSVLPKPSTKTLPAPLVACPTVPHSESRRDVPLEWAWTEAPTAPATPPTAATFAPMAYESGYAYPLLVWLHSDGADEHSLCEVMRHVSVRNFVATAPRGVIDAGQGFGWDQSPDAIDAAEDLVADAIGAASANFSLNPQRVFIFGAGSGGTMAMRLALRHPEWFAGAATLDGPLPAGGQPLSRVNAVRALPLMLSASRDSSVYRESHVCRDLSLLHSAGCNVHVRQYPGDDDLTTEMLAEINRWAMKIVCRN